MSTYRPGHTIASDAPRVPPLPCVGSPRFLNVKELASRLSISVSTVWRRTNDDETFPRPRKIGVGATRWMLSEVEEYEASRELMH